MHMQIDALKRTTKIVAIIIGEAVIWMIFQFAVIILLNLLHINISHFLASAGISWSVAAMAYSVATLLLGIIYTIVGVSIKYFVGINTPRWWKLFWILYSIYAVSTLLVMYCSLGAWFFEGYGYLIIEIWIAPLLWLGELELWEHIRSRRRPQKQE